MLIDELREQLKAIEPDITTITTYWNNAQLEKQFTELDTQVNQPDFWQNTNQTAISKQLQKIKTIREEYLHIVSTKKELSELLDLFQNDETELRQIIPDINRLCKIVSSFKINLLLNDPQDTSPCFLSINAGAGGTESQDWANILLRMYTRFCEREKFSMQVIDYQPAEEAGIKSATLYIKGQNGYGLLKSEHGIHRLVRISPFDANKRRHTSFASITVMPEVPDIEVSIDPNDLRIDTYRSSGAGGQHVNVTDSAIRITHIPTGTVVECQEERSQHKNRAKAMAWLQAKLLANEREKQRQEQAATRRSLVGSGDRSERIRTYNFPQGRVTDHRINLTLYRLPEIIEGEINELLDALMREHQADLLATMGE